MSESDGIGDDGSFRPIATPQSAGGGRDAEPTNITRGAALATLMRADTQDAIRPVAADLEELGFTTDAIFGLYAPAQLAEALEGSWRAGLNLNVNSPQERRLAWTWLNENADPRGAIQFLIGLLGSDLERESAIGAGALWRILTQPAPDGAFALFPDVDLYSGFEFGVLDWEPEVWSGIFATTFGIDRLRAGRDVDDLSSLGRLVAYRLRVAALWSDPLVQSIVQAVRQANADLLDVGGAAPSGASYPTPPGSLIVSTMVHGTWGWKGDWWRPGTPFHQYVVANLRKNLYSRGARYSWSGAYSQSQRIQAARDLIDWAGDVSPNGI